MEARGRRDRTRARRKGCESAGQLHQLVQDLGKALDIHPEAPQVYQAKIDGIIYSGAAVPEQRPDRRPTVAPDVTGEATDSTRVRSIKLEPDDDYAAADAVIGHHCENEWPDDFSMRAYCVRQQREAVAKLRLGRPEDVPNETFARIRQKCAAEWPDDYAMRVYCEQQQLEGYRKVSEK